MVRPPDVRALVASPEFQRLLERAQRDADETERGAPSTATQVHRLLKGLTAIANGTTKPVRRRERLTLASGTAPRQQHARSGHDGSPERISV